MSLEWIVRITTEYWPMFLRGARTTLLLATVGTVVGVVIGLLVGVARTIPREGGRTKRACLWMMNAVLAVYIEVFRGTPMIVQAMVIYYGSAIALGLHMDRLTAALFIVSINTGAYMAEIVRGGIVSIDKGQFEAAQAIGMNHWQTMFYVILPQVIRNILPATGNEFVINIKDTSVLNVISVTELFFQGKSVAGSNFHYFETFLVVSVIYLLMTFTVTRILRYLERRLDGPEHYILYANQMQVETPEDILRKQRSSFSY